MNFGRKHSRLFLILLIFLIMLPTISYGKEKEKAKEKFEVPSHVLSISKENTFPNSTEDEEIVEAGELANGLMDEIDIPIENPQLIKLLNETTLKPSPIAIGYRGMIYLGRWALNYKSLDTTINWEYHHINTNELNNLGGEQVQVMNYSQHDEKEIKGALTNKIKNPDHVKSMMLLKVKDKTKLPLSYQTVIGKGTKKGNAYNIPVQKYGYLQAYAPAINEKGEVTFGEVFIELRGAKKSIVIKNITKQGIGGWIPIQDHLSFSFQLK